MARARNIKPSFFTNEQLADNCPLGRLFFIGLWTQADYKGDLEWRERTLKIQILPWDSCDLKEIAINLDKSGLIRFYSDGDKTYVNIVNFIKHQNPHKNERDKGSEIPEYTEEGRQLIDLNTLAINPDKSRSVPESSHSDRADSLFLNPDPLFLNPDSRDHGSSAVADKPPEPKKSNPDYPPEFEAIWQAYPKREGANPKNKAFAGYRARIRDGTDPALIAGGVARYRMYCEAKGSIGTEFVMQAQRFFGKERAFENDWTITEAGHATGQRFAGHSSKSDRDDEAMRRYLEQNAVAGRDDEDLADAAGVEAGYITSRQH